MSSQAIEDIKFLAKRLSGLIEFADKADNYDALEKQVADLQKVVEAKRAEAKAAVDAIGQSNTVLIELQKNQEEHKAQHKTWLEKYTAEAKEAARATVEKARAEVAQMRKEFQDEVASWKLKVNQVKDELSNINKDRNVAQESLDSIRAQIRAIKEVV